MLEGLTIRAIAELGIPVGLVIYFLLRDYYREQRAQKREDAMVKRIQDLEQEFRSELTSLVISCNTTSRTHVQVLKNLIQTISSLTDILKRRPCVHPDSDFIPSPHQDIDTEVLRKS